MEMAVFNRIKALHRLREDKTVKVKAHVRRDEKTGKSENVKAHTRNVKAHTRRVLHGTRQSNLDSILAKGITTGHYKNWDAYTKPFENEKEVFVSTNKDLAIRFGRVGARDAPFAVVEAEIPIDVKLTVDERVEIDREGSSPISFTLKEVKPEWIKKIHYYEVGPTHTDGYTNQRGSIPFKLEGKTVHKRTVTIREAKGTRTIYVPLSMKHSLVKKHNLKEALHRLRHRPRLREVVADVDAHTRTSKTGKQYPVKRHDRKTKDGKPQLDDGKPKRTDAQQSPTTTVETGKVNLNQQELKSRQENIDVLSAVAREWLDRNVKDNDPTAKQLAELSKHIGEKYGSYVDSIVGAFDDRAKYENRPSVYVPVKNGPDIYLLGWRDTIKDIEGTEIHDHAISRAGVYVHKGTVVERLFGVPKNEFGKDTLTFKAIDRDLAQGGTIRVQAPYIHEVYDKSDKSTAVTIHSYYPPLKEMSFYQVQGKTLKKTGHWKYSEEDNKAPITEHVHCCHSRLLAEAKVRVKTHTRHSKTGKTFTVKQHEREILSRYVTGGSYLAINSLLRAGKSHPDVKTLDAVIDRNKTTTNMTVYRAISGATVGLKVGDVTTDKGYYTASKDKSTAINFSPLRHGAIELSAPKGTNYVSLVPFQKEAYREAGLLLKRNLKIKITGERYEQHKKYGKVRILTAELTEATTNVKQHTRHSKTGKTFTVKQHERQITKAAADMKIIGATPNEEKYLRELMSRHDEKIVNLVPSVTVLDRKQFRKAVAASPAVKQAGYEPDGREVALYDEITKKIFINRSEMVASAWKGVIDHELGHAAYYHSKKATKWFDTYDTDEKFDRHTWYSKENERESFAESYMAYMATGGKAKNPKYKRTFTAVKSVLGSIGKKNLYSEIDSHGSVWD